MIKPKHTAGSLAKQLVAGLRDGSIILGRRAGSPREWISDFLVEAQTAIHASVVYTPPRIATELVGITLRVKHVPLVRNLRITAYIPCKQAALSQ